MTHHTERMIRAKKISEEILSFEMIGVQQYMINIIGDMHGLGNVAWSACI